jgi:hypothetical protein
MKLRVEDRKLKLKAVVTKVSDPEFKRVVMVDDHHEKAPQFHARLEKMFGPGLYDWTATPAEVKHEIN